MPNREEELKVLNDKESFKNTTVLIKYKEDLKETETVREHISSSQNIIEEIDDSKEK